jgi:hypothetical protein
MKKKLMKELFAEETALLLYTHNCNRKMKSWKFKKGRHFILKKKTSRKNPINFKKINILSLIKFTINNDDPFS